MLLFVLLLTGFALALSLFFTPVVRVLALRWNLVDKPEARKVHKKPIPRVGGIAVFAAYFGSCLVGSLLLINFLPSLPVGFSAIKAIGPATLLIFLVGLTDDVLNLRPWKKFAVQIAASLMVVSAGVNIGGSYFFDDFPILARVATVIWLLGCTNAVNLIDGLDGLAGGIALLATITTLIASLMSGNFELMIAAAPLAGALIGFLVFNSNPASIFLGDSGSLVLGFLLGCFSLLWTAKSGTLLGMAAPLMTLAVPLIDTSLAILRRFLRGQPIFLPDRSHVHHRLLAVGLSHRRAVLCLYVAGAIAGVLALSLVWVRSHGEAIVLLAFVSIVVLGVQRLGYPELHAARKVLLRGGLLREIGAHLEVQTLAESLIKESTAEGCWSAVQRNSSRFGFEVLRMGIGTEAFGAADSEQEFSLIHIAISERDWVELLFDTDQERQPNMLLPFVATIRSALSEKNFAADEQREVTLFPNIFHQATVYPIQ